MSITTLVEGFIEQTAKSYRDMNFRHTITTTDFDLPDDRALAKQLYDQGIIEYSDTRHCRLTECGAELVMNREPITEDGMRFMQDLRSLYANNPSAKIEPGEAENRGAWEMQARGYVRYLSPRLGWELTAAGRNWMHDSKLTETPLLRWAPRSREPNP